LFGERRGKKKEEGAVRRPRASVPIDPRKKRRKREKREIWFDCNTNSYSIPVPFKRKKGGEERNDVFVQEVIRPHPSPKKKKKKRK